MMKVSGEVWHSVELCGKCGMGCGKFHTGALLRTNSVISPYYLRSSSVSSPYLLRIYTIGIDTEQVRTWHGWDTIPRGPLALYFVKFQLIV